MLKVVWQIIPQFRISKSVNFKRNYQELKKINSNQQFINVLSGLIFYN